MSEKRIRVLLIEGDSDESSMVKRHLRDTDESLDLYTVTEAVRVSTACSLLTREAFDVVILDLKVPQNVGLEGFTRIRAQRPEIPIILLSGLQDEALARQGVLHGALDYLLKGTLDCCLLKRAMRSAIEKKKLSLLIERLLDTEPAARLIVDGDALVLYANPAAEALFGAHAKDLAGKPFAYPRAGAAAAGKPEDAPAEMTVGAIEWNGAPARLISFLQVPCPSHITTQHGDEAERRRLEDIKIEFTRRLSHELRNTMATVKTALYCLSDPQTGPLTPRQTRLVDMISRNTDRQVRVVDKITDLARFEAGKLRFNFQRLEMSQILDEFARESAHKSDAPSLEFEFADNLPTVNGDADLLLQVLRNLLDNALRFAKDKIVVNASLEGSGGVRVAVSDDGRTVPRDQLRTLFTPFSELDKRKGAVGFKGGLGLTLCREIIEGHGGLIWADSDAAGSRFTFILPGNIAAKASHAEPSRDGAVLS